MHFCAPDKCSGLAWPQTRGACAVPESASGAWRTVSAGPGCTDTGRWGRQPRARGEVATHAPGVQLWEGGGHQPQMRGYGGGRALALGTRRSGRPCSRRAAHGKRGPLVCSYGGGGAPSLGTWRSGRPCSRCAVHGEHQPLVRGYGGAQAPGTWLMGVQHMRSPAPWCTGVPALWYPAGERPRPLAPGNVKWLGTTVIAFGGPLPLHSLSKSVKQG